MNWPLNKNNFHFIDRVRMALFFLNPSKRWTRGKLTKKLEEEACEYFGCKYSVFVSSGSTANTVLAMYLKDFYPDKKEIIFPSTTWSTSISPFIREGFVPKFIDISLDDFSLDLNSLEDYLKENNKKVCCVFVTSLIGFNPDIEKLKQISEKYNVKVMLDNCENTFGQVRGKNISSYFTSTTSTYFGHQIQTIEGGFIFTDSLEEYEYFLMLINHGMNRFVNNSKYRNKEVEADFDFYCLGNNFRNNDFNAFLGLIELKRIKKYIDKRVKCYKAFKEKVSGILSLPKERVGSFDVPFCLPIITKSKEKKRQYLDFCVRNNIETRPIISGNLLNQRAFKKFGSKEKFKNSNFLEENGFYVGLFYKLKNRNLKKLYTYIIDNP